MDQLERLFDLLKETRTLHRQLSMSSLRFFFGGSDLTDCLTKAKKMLAEVEEMEADLVGFAASPDTLNWPLLGCSSVKLSIALLVRIAGIELADLEGTLALSNKQVSRIRGSYLKAYLTAKTILKAWEGELADD